MSYPVKAHTRGNSAEFFKHVFAIFPKDTHEPVMEALAEMGIECLLDFLGENVTFLLNNLKYQGRDLNLKEKRTLKNVHEWMIWESSNRPGIDFGTLKMDDYDQYLNTKFLSGTSFNPPTTMSQPAVTSTAPMMSPFVTNVKLDVKQYPVFNGDIAQWAKFKRGVLALAATHGLDDVFDPKFVVPDPTQLAWSIFNEKNKFVYSIWVSRVHSGLALTTLREYEDTKDGRGAYLKFLEIYEGKHNLEQVALLALAKLNSMSLQYKSPGGVPAFIAKFRGALQDLKEANEPVSDAMAKSMLLSKVKDRDYSHIVDILIASSDDFEACVTRLLDKYNMMNSGNTGNRQTNKVRRGNNRPNNRNNNNNRQNTNRQQYNNYISPEDWSKLSRDERVKIIKKRESDKNSQKNISNGNAKGKTSFAPKNTRHIKNVEQTDYDDEDEEEEEDEEEHNQPTARPSINSIMTSI